MAELPSPAGPGSGQPRLEPTASGVLMTWLEPDGSGDHVFYLDRWVEGGWEGRRPVARGPDFFVNWADLPGVVPVGEDLLAAHWLVRGPEGGYDYGIRVAFSEDDGATWSEPWIPHEDRSPTEHGFVSAVPLGGRSMGLVWLDGRDFAGDDHGPDGPEMSLRFRTAGPGTEPGPERLVDDRVCDCCQTDLAATDRGLLLVYRDRSGEEVRDISRALLRDGRWSDPAPVHRDGWVFPACPVNGPAVSARGSRAAVAWFTGAGEEGRVRVAWSEDGGETFGAPVRVDEGDPAGRVDLTLLDDGSALVTWLERRNGRAHVRIRQVWADGRAAPPASVGGATGNRSSGFPRMAPDGSGGVLFAWTDDTGGEGRVRVARIPIDGAGPTRP